MPSKKRYPANPYSVQMKIAVARKLKEDFTIQLLNDELKSTEFLIGCMLAYVNGEPKMMALVQDFKDYINENRLIMLAKRKNPNHHKSKQKIKSKLFDKGEKQKKDFGLTSEELEDIFDDIAALSD